MLHFRRLPQVQAKTLTKAKPTYHVQVGFIALALVLLQAISAAARGAPESFADLVEDISPAVVNITTTTKVAKGVTPRGIVPEGSPFEDFFKEFQDRQGGNNAPRPTSALGSGFVISEDGYVVTNNHVIEGADEIMVEFNDGTELKASIVGTDKNIDIALLKVVADGPLAHVSFGDSDIARVGDWVMAIGNPLGQGFSVSAGIISARNRELSGAYDDYIQTDAAINRGNSGGPLFNMDGSVIGVNTAILSPNGGSIGIGFSMSANVVAPVVDQLKQFGEVRRGWLGVNIGSMTDDMATSLGMDQAQGAIVLDVFDGPAKDAGIQEMDVILSFNGQDVADSGELVRLVGKAAVGSNVKTIVLRDGKRKSVDVVLGQRPDPDQMAARDTMETQPEPSSTALLGMDLSEITDALRGDMGIGDDVVGLVVVGVDQKSVAYDKGIRDGDVITDAGQKKVENIQDLQDRVQETQEAGRESLLLLVRREGQPMFVVLPLE